MGLGECDMRIKVTSNCATLFDGEGLLRTPLVPIVVVDSFDAQNRQKRSFLYHLRPGECAQFKYGENSVEVTIHE